MPDAQADISPLVDRRRALAREWGELVARARRLDGFADFLGPPRLATLLPAAVNGPVVVVNVSRWRCDALLVRTSGVRVVALPGLTAAEVVARADGYLRVLRNVDEAARALYRTRLRHDAGDRTPDATAAHTAAKRRLHVAQREREATLAAIMEWLWTAVADPVLTALGFVDTPAHRPWPRVWWCPTGPLALLPLHAAGYHAERRAVLDRVVSSYTPALRVLARAAREPAPADADPRILVVAPPEAPDQVPLRAAARQRDLLTSLFADRATLLAGAAATRDAVRAHLPRHRWAHFICHGRQDLADPARGGVVLHDGTLSVADVGAGRYRGEFAFLPACRTAIGGAPADEAVTLAAALHHTGYRHVVGTLWSVHDSTAADVVRAVYTDLTVTGAFEPDRAAYALHDAVRALRDMPGLPSSAWTPFTHTGP